MRPSELRRALSPARVMVSHHDFRRTPRNLPGIVRQLARAGGDAVKIAAHCHSISDSVRICELARGRRDVVAIPMGEIGLAGRVLSLREGSALAYAAVEQATAPGQLSLDAMEHLYRAARITRRTRVYGVIGNPIGHSLSPLLHNTRFSARKFDAVFVPFLVRDLRDFLRCHQAVWHCRFCGHDSAQGEHSAPSGRLRSAGRAHRGGQYRGGSWRRALVRVQYGLRWRAAQSGAPHASCGKPRPVVRRGRRGASRCFRAGASGLDRLSFRAASGTRPGSGPRRWELKWWRAPICAGNFSTRS